MKEEERKIKYEDLVNIPFCECSIDQRNMDSDRFEILYKGDVALDDYYHAAGCYLDIAVDVFKRVRNKKAKWMNLHNLFTLRNCIRENFNHGIVVDALIFGNDFDGEDPKTMTPLTKQRFDFLCKTIKELDPYATI